MFGLFRRRRPKGTRWVCAEIPESMRDQPLYRVRLLVTPGECLTRGQLLRQWVHGAGVRNWWLQHSGGQFIRVADLPRGDQTIDCLIDLPRGRYTLGVGRAPDAIRIPIVVPRATADGAGEGSH